MDIPPELIAQGLLQYIILAGSIALHEYGHAKAADKVGDYLPRSQGRVTLNPLAHLDPIGTGLIPMIMIFGSMIGGGMPFALIGWGKPVQISLQGFVGKERTRADLLITAAGPLVNLIIATATIPMLVLAYVLGADEQVIRFFSMMIFINCALIVFNLIPIPPLDGSHFMRYLVGMREETYMWLSQYGFIILIILVNIGPFRAVMSQAILMLALPFFYIAEVIARLFL